MAVALDEILARVQSLDPAARAKLVEETADAFVDKVWFPNLGPQQQAYNSPADALLYGGQGGGGKTDLILGLALTAHRRSLIMRRTYATLAGLTQRVSEIAGRNGLRESPPPLYKTSDGRLIEFGACQHLGDEQDWQGRPHDLLCPDETVQFLEMQIRFLMGWVRSADEGQRCRVVMATNPPVDASGDWIIGMFRPWLDLTHHNPAKPGELRWFVTNEHGEDEEVDGATPIVRGIKTYIPKSRTFIPAALADNPYLINTGYQAQLDALPEPIRSAVRDGNFMASRADAANQVIPTAWVQAAQARWRPNGGDGIHMTTMGVDPAGGGADEAAIGWRQGSWYAPLVMVKGPATASGSEMASVVLQHRRHNAPMVIDVGGGYAGALIEHLSGNETSFVRFDAAGRPLGGSRDGSLVFVNRRAEAWWRLREGLDPDQDGGSKVALPPDSELMADLTAPTFKIRVSDGKLLLESKDDIRKRLGRSTNKGDAVVMAYEPGARAVERFIGARRDIKVVVSHERARRR